MSAVSIRPAKTEDAAFLPAVEVSAGEAFRAVPGLEWIAGGDDILSAEDHIRYIDQDTVWVAEAKGRPVGFVTAQRESDENCLHIWELSVESGHQGKGIGRQLMEAAQAYASATSLSAITLTTFRELAFNEVFYQKLGYRTLAEDELPDRLRDILKREAENGLPINRRCAMKLVL